MNKSISTTIILLCCGYIFGQEKKNMEWEIINVGVPFSVQANNRGVVSYNDVGFVLGSEVRYNLPKTNFSLGAQFTMTGWNRMSNGSYTQHQNPFVFLGVADYNYRAIHRNFVPFAGMGLGFSIVRSWPYDDESMLNTQSYFACSPRIGIEFFKRIRLTTEYQFIGGGHSFFDLKLGFVVGGR